MAQVKFVTWLAGLTAKSTPTDTDQMYVGDTGTSKVTTWAQVKATLKTYFDTLYAAVGAITGSGLTMGTGKLLGRGTAGTGALEEITLGTNLSFTGTTLNAAGGSTSPGGSTTQVQYNNAGAFEGNANLTYNSVDGSITATTFRAQRVLSGPVLAVGSADADPAIKLNSDASGFLVINNANNSYKSFTAEKYTANTTGGYALLNGHSVIYSNGWSFLTTNNSKWANITAGNIFPQGYDTTDYTYNVALGKNASGVAEINSGTNGTLRDLKLRNLIGTGNLATGIVAKSADYTATTSDGTIEVDATAGAKTITLFAASSNPGKILTIKKIDSSGNAVTIDGNASETIDGATTLSLASQYSTATIQVNAAGTAWYKLSGI